MSGLAFGIDIGGTGIRAAPVDVDTGALAAARVEVPTPSPPVPAAVSPLVVELIERFAWDGPIGAGFPTIVTDGIAVEGGGNMHPSWAGVDIAALLEGASGRAVHVLNDADAAGLAEVTYGAGAGRSGVVLVLTLGTGVGSALFVDGILVPNTELGRAVVDGVMAEKWVAASALHRDGLSWRRWARRVDRFIDYVESLLTLELVIVGGGASRHANEWLPYVTGRAEITPAVLSNDAGIVGAALAATADRDQRTSPPL